MISEFRGKYRFLSNFYMHGSKPWVILDGVPYPSVEHAYQKALTNASIKHRRAGKKFFTFKAETLCLSDWAIKLGVSIQVLSTRIKSWSLERALSTYGLVSKKDNK